jgi:hypothetical protein
MPRSCRGSQFRSGRSQRRSSRFTLQFRCRCIRACSSARRLFPVQPRNLLEPPRATTHEGGDYDPDIGRGSIRWSNCFGAARGITGPVVWLQRSNVYAVSRYEDVWRVLRDAETFRSGQGVGLNQVANSAARGSTRASDGDTHYRFRQVIGRAGDGTGVARRQSAPIQRPLQALYLRLFRVHSRTRNLALDGNEATRVRPSAHRTRSTVFRSPPAAALTARTSGG